jgi:YVTN family beta-propeller protein
MITDPDRRVALSCLGWVDHGSVWRFDAASQRQSSIEMSDADYLRVFTGNRDHLVVQHNWGASRFRVSAHAWSSPDRAVCSIDVGGWEPTIEGDSSVWATLPSAFVGVLGDDATGAAGYFVLTIVDGAPRLSRLDWFGDDYDHGYQGVVSVVQIPQQSSLLFGVQRSSDLVLTDLDGGQVRRIPLAGRLGNPQPILSNDGRSLWATDYDTVVRLDVASWRVVAHRMLQPAAAGTRMFVGDPWLSPDESLVLVARPGSGDVAVIDPQTLSVRAEVQLGHEPLVAVGLASNQILARDWKTGVPLLGDLPKTRRWKLGRR